MLCLYEQSPSQHETVTKTTTKEISGVPSESSSQVTFVKKTIIKTVTSTPASPQVCPTLVRHWRFARYIK